jgi:hypothetical protein
VTASLRESALTNVEIVTYALAELGGVAKAVHLEQIAVKAHELAPGSFRWDLDQYGQFIDKDKVRVSLTDAEKTEKGALVRGVGVARSRKSKRTDLWRITAEGAAWVLENGDRIHRGLGGPTPRLKKTKAEALRKRLSSASLFEEFERTGSVTSDPYAFTDLLECSPDAADSIIQQRFDNLRAQVLLLDEAQILAFLDACGAAHAEMLGESTR